MDRIELNGVRIYAYHGVLEQERKVGNWFEVTVHLEADMSAIMQTDDIDSGISYVHIFEIVKEQMAIPSKTLENVTWRIKTALLTRFPHCSGGRITVAKITPPFPALLQNAAFTHAW